MAPDGTDYARFRLRNDPSFAFNVLFQFDPQETPEQAFEVGRADDDRALYRQLRNYAGWFMREMARRGDPLAETGLHLVWQGGRTHMAITHHARGTILRKYSVIVSIHGRPLQIILTFAAPAPLERFLAFAPMMDCVVDSIRVSDDSHKAG
jgi:hypothetical protein